MATSIYFERRELKSYAEPITPTDLKEGAVYLSLMFMGEKMLVPILEPVVFIGRNLSADDIGITLYFQSFDSYRQGVRFDSASENDLEAFSTGSEDDFKYIFEYERALDCLMKCALGRRKA